MDAILLNLLNVSISASFLAVAVIIFRLIFKKAPKALTVALWALVAVRLLCPVSIESNFSLIPNNEVLPPEILTVDPTKVVDRVSFDLISNPVFSDTINREITVNVDSFQLDMLFLSFAWLGGVVLMLLYAVISYLRIYFKIKVSLNLKDNVYLCDKINTPFIFGLFRPKIFIPSGMDEETVNYVLAHENAHLKRRDHLWKPLGFVLLSVYWFNPVMWISYILLCRDIELACDEKVIKQMEVSDKKAYSEALLSCSAPQRMITVCPVAFGEVGVKQRIKSVLNYKRPAFWIIAAAVIASIIVGVCFMTEPVDVNDGGSYTSIEGVDETFFPMKNIVADGHSFKIERGINDNYSYSVSDYNGMSFVREFLQDVKISKLPIGSVDHMVEIQYDGIITVYSNKFDNVIIVFHDDFQKMYIQKGNSSYSVSSSDYVVLNCERARDFFKKEEYTFTDSVWEYTPLSSNSYDCWLTFVFDDIEEIEKIEDNNGKAQIDDVAHKNPTIIWHPSIEKDITESTIKVYAFRKNHSKVVFDITIKKIGQKNDRSTYYRIIPGNDISMELNKYSEYVFRKPEFDNGNDVSKPQAVPGGEGITILDLSEGAFVAEGLLTDITSLRLVQNNNIIFETKSEGEIASVRNMLLSLRFGEDFYAHHSPEALSELTEYEIALNFSGSVMGDVIRLDKECKQMWFISESGGYTSTFEVLNGEVLKDYISQNVISSPDLDVAVSEAILSINGKYSWTGECPAEGHIIMGTDKEGDIIKAYVLEAYSSYGFDNGWFVEQGGHSTACVMTFLEADNGYVFQDVEYTEDGAHLKDSVKRLFPLRYRKRAMSFNEEDRQSLSEQCRKYAEAYLKEKGRTEKIGSYGDVERISLTDLGVSVEASNRILEQKGSTSYCHIGYYEELQDGVRYLCRTAYSETENIVVFIKESYDSGQIAQLTVFDSLTGEIISDEQPVNMGYFDGKVLSVNEKGKYAVVEPLKHSKLSETAEKVYVSLDFDSKVKAPDLYEGLYVSVFYEGSVATSGSKTVTMDGTSAIYLYADINYKGNPTLKTPTQEYTTKSVIA